MSDSKDIESQEDDNNINKINIKDTILDLDNDTNEEYVLAPKKKAKTSKIRKPLTEEIPSPYDAIFEYYRLKEKFENDININKRKIINNPTLSNREKRSEYMKLMPKCVNCKRPSKRGTIFSIIYQPADDMISEYRIFKAICGDLADPCNLHIEINVGIKNPLDEELNKIRNEILEAKNNIINDKNKLLFGLITTETALENFENNRTYISELTSIYEKYLDIWNKEVEDPQKKLELEESLVKSYEIINNIKDCIVKMNENDNNQFAIEAATIYHTTLQPLLNKIRHLKYSENMVFHDEKNDCKLIQRKYTTDSILISGYTSKVVAYDVGLKAMIGKKKKTGLIIEDSDEEKGIQLEKELTINIQEPSEIAKLEEPLEDEPIIGEGKDGISWTNPDYQYLWSRLPEKLKTEFKSNIEWMNMFMKKCVNERKKHGPEWNGCALPTPPNLVIPPREMDNGQYDFGVSIYNRAFNKQPKSLQQTYLTFYSENPETKEKNYNMLIDAMNRLVEREVDFGRGYF
jgi:hypothetical protein